MEVVSKEKSKVSTIHNRTVLENGIRVVSEFVPYVNSVSLGAWVNVGSRDEDELSNGITHFIEHMLFKGTSRRNAREIAEFVENMGGYLNGFTTKENTCLYVRTLSEHLKEAIEILSDMIQNPIFDEKELEKEKEIVLEEIKDTRNEVEEYIADLLEYQIYYPHPLAFPITGTEKTVKKFTREKLFEHLNKFYNPANIVISAAGNLDHGKLVEYVSKFFNCKSKNGFCHMREKPKGLAPTTYIAEMPTNQVHVCFGTTAYGSTDPRRKILTLLDIILGDGMSSRLFQNVRENYGFVYSIYSFYTMFKDSGVFGIYFACDKRKASRALEVIFNEFESVVKNGISEDELKRAKAQFKSSLLIGSESLSNRMQRLAQIELIYDGVYSDINEVIQDVERISVDEIWEVAREVLRKDRFTTVIINPKK